MTSRSSTRALTLCSECAPARWSPPGRPPIRCESRCWRRFTETNTFVSAAPKGEPSSGQKPEMQTSLALKHHPIEGRLTRSLLILVAVLALSTLIALWAGYQRLDLDALRHDEMARAIFFRLRLPRVVMAALVGATLAVVGAALQALFRN